MDGVQTSLRGARVAANGASARLAGLSRSISDKVTAAVATALKGMVQAHPVANFMGGGLAEVVALLRTARSSAMENGATIAVELGRPVGDALWEVAITQVAADVGHIVEVEGVVVALAERTLHGHLIAVVGPAGVDGSGDLLEGERNTAISIIGVQDSKLLVEGSILGKCQYVMMSGTERGPHTEIAIGRLGRSSNNVHVDIDIDGSNSDSAVLSSNSFLLSEVLSNDSLGFVWLGGTTS